MGKKKSGGKDTAPRCPVANCKVRLQGDAVAECVKCGLVVCQEHKYPTDHDCEAENGTKSAKPASGISIGVVKVSNAVKVEKDDSEKQEKEILDELVKASSKDLLEELIAFGGSSARYESSLIVRALSSDSKAVKSALFGATLSGIVEFAVESNQLESVLTLLQNQLGHMKTQSKLSSSEEKRGSNLASLFGSMLDAHEATKQKPELLDFAISFCTEAKNEKLAKAGGSDLVKRVADAQWGGDDAKFQSQGLPLLTRLIDEALKLDEEDDVKRSGYAFAIAGICGGVGVKLCGDLLETKVLTEAITKPKQTGKILSAMKITLQVTKEIGGQFEPFIMDSEFIINALNSVYEKAQTTARSATKKALIAVLDKLGPRGVRQNVPVLINGCEDTSWKIKAMSLQLLSVLAKRQAEQMFRDLPLIIPAVMECARDTKKQVMEAATDALDNLGTMVTNAETQKLMPWLLEALKDPEKVDPCLDELMDMTFVNSVDAQSLAFIVPVLLRGLRDGNTDMKLKSSITVGNVCALVADVHDLRPFYPLLIPELKKLQEHSTPRVRETATQAKENLQADISMTRRKSSHNNEVCSVSDEAIAILDKALDESSVKNELSERGFEYLTEMCKMFLYDYFEDIDEGMPKNLVMKDAMKKVMEGATSLKRGKMNESMCVTIATGLVNSLWHAQGFDHQSNQNSEKEYLIYLPSIILAFASRILLRRAGLFLEKGQRYAVIGNNGVGKSTLLNRLAERNIDGFPDDISVYYIRHEIMDDEKDLTVLKFMDRDLEEDIGGGTGGKKNSKKKKSSSSSANKESPEERQARITKALDDVGFTEELRNKEVSALSGGWKMRLAIARSMLYEKDLFLLDEPTNHCSASFVEWLQQYLTTLTNTTIVFVSHDYDFVDFVATRVMHIANLKLSFHDFGFKKFQTENPEIVAALPKKDDSAGGATAIDFLENANGDENAAQLAADIKPINFPEGCKLEGIANRGKAVIDLKDVSFTYPGTDRKILKHVSCKLSLNSRVALKGPNGAGKTTLLKLIVGELELNTKDGSDTGVLYKHHNCRTAYVSQHSMHHLGDHLELTPCDYIQRRFWEGQDRESAKMITVKLTPEDEATMAESGEICEILSRVQRGKKLFYEVRKNGRMDRGDNKDYRSLDQLEALGKPHVTKLVRLFDEKLKIIAAGVDLRPLTAVEMIKHMEEFGIPKEIAQRKIRWMSGGQKARLVLAAAMWVRPHIVVLDEPSNYLDQDSLAALTFALKKFRGGVVIISHHEGFVNAIANELWHFDNGEVTVESLKDKDTNN